MIHPFTIKKDGEWAEIDNTLVSATLVGDALTGDVRRDTATVLNWKTLLSEEQMEKIDNASQRGYYENNQNDFVVQLPKALTDETPVMVKHNEHTLRFSFVDADKDATASVTQPMSEKASEALMQEKLASVAEPEERAAIQNEFASSAANICSSVSYAGVKDDVDINYYIYGQRLKEDIVLHNVPTTFSYSFNFTFTGLQAALQPDNSVLFSDDDEQPVFWVEAPYMADSREGYSRDITVVLTPTATGCTYTLQPSREWLESPDRVYPVIIDPSVKTERNASYIHDNGVQQSDPTTNYITSDRIYVGSGPNSTAGYMYIKFTQWPSNDNLSSASITSAKLNLNYYPQASWQTGNNITINVYKVTSAWNTNTLTWNNKPGVSGSRIGHAEIDDARGKTSGTDSYTVTSWVKAHYKNPSADYGIRLQPSSVKSSINRVCYVSSDYYANTALRPQVEIFYNRYNLYLKHFHDEGYLARYSSARADIAEYATVVENYYREVFGINIINIVNNYTSIADDCQNEGEHGKYYHTESCHKPLTAVCRYDLNGQNSNTQQHCTNAAKMLSTYPSALQSIAEDTKTVLWTGHELCEGCPVNGCEISEQSVTNGEQILVQWGNYSFPEGRRKTSIGTIAHELGHSLGCVGDFYNTCESTTCIMYPDVTDTLKCQRLTTYDIEAYCSDCRGKIKAYRDTYLRLAN